MAQTKPKAGQFYGVSNNGTDGQFLKTDGTGGMSWDSPITNPTLTSIDYPGTATAADPAGGESVIINGTLFASGITCTVGGTSAVTAFNSATQITITTPAKTAGQYAVAVTNTDGGTASQANFIQYSGVPVWSTASGSLGSVQEGNSASFQVTATEGSDTIEYAVTTGSLPSGLSLNTNTGAITGTAPSVSADTTTTFSITATDDENQTSSARSFSITVTNNAPSSNFNTVLYTGTSASHAITGVGFQPDWVWIKRRSSTESSALYDSLRGINKQLESNSSSAQATNTAPYEGFTAFGTDGFTVDNNGGTNSSGQTYVAWCFKGGGTPSATNSAGAGNAPTLGSVMIDGSASTATLAGTNPATKISANNSLGFSIISYTGTGSATTFAHGLNGAPTCIFAKKLTTGSGNRNWTVYHQSLTSATYELYLNLSDAEYNSAGAMYDGAPTSTVINVGNDDYINGSGQDYIAYAFQDKPGFVKTGSYVGNGSSSGPLINVGFEPAFLMIKTRNANDSWFMVDNKRETTNPRGDRLFANSSAAEASEPGAQVNFLANGFEITGSGGGQGQTNSSGATYVYIAIAADPSTTTPSLADSFGMVEYTGDGNSSRVITGLDFKPDMVWNKQYNGTTAGVITDTVTGLGTYLMPSSTNGGAASTYYASFDNGGWTMGNNALNANSNESFINWAWKAAGGTATINTDGTNSCVVSANAAAGFSIVNLTKDNTNTETFGHGLGAIPEMIILKRTASADDWYVYHKDLGNTTRISLNSTAAKVTGTGVWGSTTPTSSVFTLQNQSGGAHTAYCFTSIANYSSIGTYTASGSAGSPTITTGFPLGFVIIKNVDKNQEWISVDSLRGLNKSLQPNSTAAEGTNGNTLSTTPTSFTIEVSGGGVNYQSGDTMIYAAFKQN